MPTASSEVLYAISTALQGAVAGLTNPAVDVILGWPNVEFPQILKDTGKVLLSTIQGKEVKSIYGLGSPIIYKTTEFDLNIWATRHQERQIVYDALEAHLNLGVNPNTGFINTRNLSFTDGTSGTLEFKSSELIDWESAAGVYRRRIVAHASYQWQLAQTGTAVTAVEVKTEVVPSITPGV
jgi:hypothetical protein